MMLPSCGMRYAAVVYDFQEQPLTKPSYRLDERARILQHSPFPRQGKTHTTAISQQADRSRAQAQLYMNRSRQASRRSRPVTTRLYDTLYASRLHCLRFYQRTSLGCPQAAGGTTRLPIRPPPIRVTEPGMRPQEDGRVAVWLVVRVEEAATCRHPACASESAGREMRGSYWGSRWIRHGIPTEGAVCSSGHS